MGKSDEGKDVISPDKIAEGEKVYENPDFMDALAGAPGDVEDIALAPGEKPYEGKQAKTEPVVVPLEKDKTETKVKPEFETKPEIDQIVDEIMGNEDEEKTVIPPREEKVVDKAPKEAEYLKIIAEKEKEIVKLSETVRSYESKVSGFGNVSHVIEELGFKEMNQADLVNTMKELKTVAFNFMKNPKFLEIIENFSKGNFVIKGKTPRTISSFMPKGMEEDFDLYESQNDPNSDSWKAREQFEEDRENEKTQMRNIMESVSSYKGSLNGGDANITDRLLKAKKDVEGKLELVKTFAIDEYEDGRKVFDEFYGKFQKLDPEILKVMVAVTAKKLGIKSKAMSKLEENNGKVSPEAMAKERGARQGKASIPFEEYDDSEFEKTFSDWGNNYGIVK